MAVDGISIAGCVDHRESQLHTPLFNLYRRCLDLNCSLNFFYGTKQKKILHDTLKTYLVIRWDDGQKCPQIKGKTIYTYNTIVLDYIQSKTINPLSRAVSVFFFPAYQYLPTITQMFSTVFSSFGRYSCGDLTTLIFKFYLQLQG